MRTLLTASDLRKTYGRQVILDGVSFDIHEKARIGLIGRNGAGKTTLLRILSGTEEPDSGSARLMPETRLGVLDQHEQLPAEGTVMDYLTARTGKPTWTCAKLAGRFGVRAEELSARPTALSGGFQMRVKIIRMLLEEPNLLLLDEPVNYLDLSTLLLFENFLRQYSGAFVVTSHDREILQNLCTTTWDVARGALTTFAGDVETYADWKDEQAEYAKKTNKRLRRQMATAQEFVDRFGAKASQASRAQSKLKHIAKLRTKLKEMVSDLPTAAFRIDCPHVPNGTALRCQDLAIGYDGVAVARNIDFEIPRGSKVAIVGENGRGKSTLLKTLAGVIPAIDGAAKWWHKADIGYFSQLSEDTLSSRETVLETLMRAARHDASGERILATAGAFLFREDDLEKNCSILSGGERARLRLAMLVLQEHNVLLLDEPTNHLDAETVEVLAQALKDYAGTVLVVSHARTFMNALSDRIWEVRNGGIRHYPGTYEEYVADLSADADLAWNDQDAAVPDAAEAEKRERALLERERRRKRQKLEEKLNALEKERGDIHGYFFENPTDYAPEKQRRLGEVEEAIAQVEKEWMKLAE
jgi:ATP-binding cassette subfamily F protein 3